ncbi:MAG: hypothetical protein MJ211_15725, partial [Bacteroidales bacterium]|nr:hypothetical protein [Bacteroidales bacterium]
GQGLTFEVYDEHSRQIYSKGAKVEGGKAEADWVYHWNGIKLDAKPKFTFKVTGARCKETESGELEVSGKIDLQFVDKNYRILDNLNFKLIIDSNEEDATTDSNGKFSKEDLIPGKCEIVVSINKDYQRKQNTKFELKDEKEILGFVRNEKMKAELFTFYNYAVICNINNDFWSN